MLLPTATQSIRGRSRSITPKALCLARGVADVEDFPGAMSQNPWLGFKMGWMAHLSPS